MEPRELLGCLIGLAEEAGIAVRVARAGEGELPLRSGLCRVRGRPLLVLSATFALFYYLVMGASPVRMARYLTPVMPVVALLVAALVAAVATRLGSHVGRRAVFAGE